MYIVKGNNVRKNCRIFKCQWYTLSIPVWFQTKILFIFGANWKWGLCHWRVSFYFSKATVNHSILLDKLYHYGITGCVYSWFKGYLSSRHQFVTYDDVTSFKQVIRCGVPQGSILAPLLFLIYINDLSAACDHSQPFLFADDTYLFISCKNICQLQQNMRSDLMSIAEWLKANKLSLNIKKTHFMVFTNKIKTPPNMELHIGGQPIERVEKKNLGLIVDHKITWKNISISFPIKLQRELVLLKKFEKCLNSDTLISLYFSFVYPYMIYCNHVWGNTCKSNMHSLVLLQMKIIRIICGVKPKEHTGPLLKNWSSWNVKILTNTW